MGFPDRCIPLDPSADEDELAQLCREHTARLENWIADRKAELKADAAGAGVDLQQAFTPYTGSVLSACRFYQTHPMSGFHAVKANTRKTYLDSLKIIEATVGARLLKKVMVPDIRYWYAQWRRPALTTDQGGNAVIGPERIDRAHDAVEMFRTVLRFCASMRIAEAKLLNDELKLVKFEKGGAREEEMTYPQVAAFIRKALEFGDQGIMPRDRALYMAIGTAAQFELLLRQKDIIGDRVAERHRARDLKRAPRGATVLDFDGFSWVGFFTWEGIPGWRWRMRTSKSKYRSAAVFDLSNFGLLMPLLEAVPQAQRSGAVIKDETGRPVREGSYRRWFRQIARAAGIPDEVWNMDTRSGGATEAEEAGAALKDIQGALTHSKEGMTLRYLRKGRTRSIANVADARRLDRKKGET
jgi:hypothetical protein